MKESFDQFTRRNGRKVYNYILRMLRNREDTEDVTQEVFVAVYAKFEAVEPDAREAYLFRTAYNRAVNFSRKRKRNPETPQSEFVEPATDDNVQPDASVDDRNAGIHDALQNLNENERTAIEMKYYQKMSYQQIAEILGITPAAVDSLLIRARKKLKKKISQDRKGSAV